MVETREMGGRHEDGGALLMRGDFVTTIDGGCLELGWVSHRIWVAGHEVYHLWLSGNVLQLWNASRESLRNTRENGAVGVRVPE